MLTGESVPVMKVRITGVRLCQYLSEREDLFLYHQHLCCYCCVKVQSVQS